MWTYQKLSIIIHYSKMYSKIYVTIISLPITKVHRIKTSIVQKMFIFKMQNFMVHLGSEHLSSGSEHHACRASLNQNIREHQCKEWWQDLSSLCREHQESSCWDAVNIVLSNRAHLPLCPRLQIKISYQVII